MYRNAREDESFHHALVKANDSYFGVFLFQAVVLKGQLVHLCGTLNGILWKDNGV